MGASSTPAAIRGAVRLLLTDPEIRRNARRIAADYARHDAPRTARRPTASLADTYN